MKSKKKRNQTVFLKWLLFVIISLVLGLKIYGFNAVNLLRNDMPMPFGYGISVVLSGSMEPSISVDDVVIVKECKAYEIGDIVVYQSGGELVLHRLIALDGNTATMKGDANDTADEPVLKSAIAGKMVYVWHGGGKTVKVIRNPITAVFVLIAAIVLLLMSYKTEEKENTKYLKDIKAEIEELKSVLEKENDE